MSTENKRCFICSPYSASSKEELDENVKLAMYGCWYAAEVLGLNSYAPHLINTQFLPNDKKGKAKGINIGLAFLETCAWMLVIVDVMTEGMETEIAFATKVKNLHIFYVSKAVILEKVEELKPDFSGCAVLQHF